MKHFKLPFSINLKRKYNDINIESFIEDWNAYEDDRRQRDIAMDNDLHIEIGKFQTFNLTINEIIDLGMRYALGKHEFRKIAAEVIELKEQIKQ